jgi:hypothetical protein
MVYSWFEELVIDSIVNLSKFKVLDCMPYS